ncbi:hypothetical protein [Tateyamaria sp.]|uniref:hypothetical protein n=1 Tax=Tateyamaria sp. TaxID=1929288 RepID=UPI00329C0C59
MTIVRTEEIHTRKSFNKREVRANGLVSTILGNQPSSLAHSAHVSLYFVAKRVGQHTGKGLLCAMILEKMLYAYKQHYMDEAVFLTKGKPALASTCICFEGRGFSADRG